MKHLKNFLVLLLFSAISLFAQPSVGDYMSVADSTWSTPITWSVWSGTAWIPATSPPTGSENITIVNAVNIDVTVNISGYMTMSTAGDINITTGSLTFGNGSTYEHAINSGSVPIATWATGSTCKFTGITSQAPGDRNQSYHNLIWNCPNQSGNLNMGFNNVTIGGDITIVSTGASSRWYLCGPLTDSTATVVINGSITQLAGQFSAHGTGNGNTTVNITVYGNITVTGGNFACTRGSQAGTGTTTWYLLGENFTMSNATTQNSNTTGAKFLFSGTTQQNLNLTNVTFTSGFPVEVATNAILDVGMTQLKSSGIFTLKDGATLQTANPFGLDSTLQTTGVVTLSTAANYTFNGTSPQVTGVRLPAAVNNFTVNNSQGVTPSQGFTVNGNLSITNGDLHLNGVTITLGPVASLIETPGNTVKDLTGKLITIRDINAPSGMNIGGMGAMLTTSANLGSTTIERYHFVGTQDGENSIFRVFNIIPTNNTGLNATLRYYFDESELNGLSEANLRLFKSPSGGNNTWTNEGGSANTSGNYIELSGIESFSYWTLFEGATTFQLTVNVANGWNMVSIPGLHPVDQNVNTWWTFRDPGANVFKYAGGYQSVTTVTPGQGYWMKHSGGWIYIIPGIQIVPHNPLAGASGWNLIGGYELSVTAANVTTNPPGLQSGPIYKYSGGYQTATTLDPGYGYWIKLNAAGQIIIPESMAKGEAVEYFPAEWGRIILTDATGINYTLYAVKGDSPDGGASTDLTQYELPPAPPTGMFDIRFNSGRIAEDINSSVKTIDMSGVTYPLTVRVEGMDIRLMDETGEAINVNLKAGEDVVISDASVMKLMVSGELIPAQYSLEQNYPNPFNPSTVIEFSLPEDVSNVKLSIYNALGEKVAELVNTALTAGKYSYQWNASNVATGMYIYELRTDNFVSVKKMLLLK